jgi:hypothetical protein
MPKFCSVTTDWAHMRHLAILAVSFEINLLFK